MQHRHGRSRGGYRNDRRDRRDRDENRDGMGRHEEGDGARPPRFRFDVVGMGYTAADFLGVAPSFPPAGSNVELTSFYRQGAGPTATTLVTLARLGASTAFIGKMGDDDLGLFMRRELEEEGVATEHVMVERGATSQAAFIMFDASKSERTAFWTRGTVSEMRADEFERDWVTAGRFLHLDTYEPSAARQAAAWAREAGVRVVMDAGAVRPGTEEAIREVEVLICTETFPPEFTGIRHPVDAAKALLDKGPRVVVTTMGPGGAVAVRKDGPMIESTGFRVPVADVAGARHVFRGAFLHGLLQERDLAWILDFANAAAALKCGSLGGASAIPRKDEIIAFLASPPDRHPSALPQKWGRTVRVQRRP